LFSLFVCTNSKLFIFVYRWGGAGEIPARFTHKMSPTRFTHKNPPHRFVWPAHKIGRFCAHRYTKIIICASKLWVQLKIHKHI
jgi:hypothetical protein